MNRTAMAANLLQIGELDLGLGLVAAPMAGMSDSSFRRLARRFGADLVVSEMVSAEGLVRGNAATWRLLECHPEERPLAVQLFGADREVMAEAAALVTANGQADLIDINAGCPVAKVLRQGAGGALMLEAARVGELVAAVSSRVKVPVTVKIRAGWDRRRLNAVEVAAAAVAAGAAAVTVHGRYVRQGFAGRADWGVIAAVRRAVPVPVIGNGDVRRPEQVQEMRDNTGCAGVMIGRAALGNPWIFQQVKDLAAGRRPRMPSMQERLEVMQEHLRLYQEQCRGAATAAQVRTRIMWYTRGLAGGARLRAALAQCRSVEAMLQRSEDFFAALCRDQGKQEEQRRQLGAS